jgi:hypothetical protein
MEALALRLGLAFSEKIDDTRPILLFWRPAAPICRANYVLPSRHDGKLVVATGDHPTAVLDELRGLFAFLELVLSFPSLTSTFYSWVTGSAQRW